MNLGFLGRIYGAEPFLDTVPKLWHRTCCMRILLIPLLLLVAALVAGCFAMHYDGFGVRLDLAPVMSNTNRVETKTQ